MPSFDIAIETDLQEVDNALQQARKEIAQRFDFRGSKSDIDWQRFYRSGRALLLEPTERGQRPAALETGSAR